MALAAALAAMLLAAHVPDVSAALSAWRTQTKNAFSLDIGDPAVTVSVPSTKIIRAEHVPYILNFEPLNACDWWTGKWPWDQTNGQPDSEQDIPFCMQEIDKDCEPKAWQTDVKADCIKTTTTSCQRHADADAWYATITTMPMDFFLMYVPTETGNNHELSEFDNIEVCAGALCNPKQDLYYAQQQEMWVSLDVSKIESLFGDSVVKSRACPLMTASGDWRYGQCITMDSIRQLMTTESSKKTCESACDWRTEASNCVGNPAMASIAYSHSADGYSVTGTATQCTTTRTAACMQNSNSMSMPICQLLGGRVKSDWGFPKCINAKFMRTQGLGSIFTEGSGDFTTPTQDNHWIGLKLPTHLDNIVHIQTFFGTESKCQNAVGNKYATSTSVIPVESDQDLQINPINVQTMRTDKTIISLHDRSIALRFKTDDWTCGPCPANTGTDDFDYTFDAASGLARCRSCELNVELRKEITVSTGRRQYTKCEQCPNHQYVIKKDATDTSTGCSFCQDSAPYRLNPTSAAEVTTPDTWNKCAICPVIANTGQPQMFDRSTQACTGVPHFQLQLNGNVLKVVLLESSTSITAEYYQVSNDDTNTDNTDWTTNGFALLPKGFFLVQETLKKALCDDTSVACNAFQYRALCGHLFEGSDMYVKSQTNTQLLLASEVFGGDVASYSIAREGKCTDCTPSNLHYYNRDCSSATNSPGSETICKTFLESGCNPKQYLYHESTRGCQQTQARSDYECRNCPLVWIEADSKYKVFIIVGCGVAAPSFTRWDPTEREQIDGVIRPMSVECFYANPDANKCTHRANHHALRDSTQRFWSSAGQNPGSDLLPYCPGGWFVDTTANECKEENLVNANAYRPQCCKLCQASIAGFMKGPDYEECPGSSTADLQRWVSSCPAGQFKNETADDGEDVCQPCTVCGS